MKMKWALPNYVVYKRPDQSVRTHSKGCAVMDQIQNTLPQVKGLYNNNHYKCNYAQREIGMNQFKDWIG